jgi:hypothetical protein
MIDVENAWEILHFALNDVLFLQNDRESRQWILRSALNDRESRQWILRFALNDREKILNLIFQRK